MKHELPDVQAGFRKGRGTRDPTANILWITEKALKKQKNIYFCFVDGVKALTLWITAHCGKFFKRWDTRPLTCLLSHLRAGQEATVRTGHGTTDWLKIGKGVRQGYILSPCLFNFYAEHIMRNAGLDEAQTGIKIAGRNINNFRSLDDAPLRGRKQRRTKDPLEESERGE